LIVAVAELPGLEMVRVFCVFGAQSNITSAPITTPL
jgi:hypothetical protein